MKNNRSTRDFFERTNNGTGGPRSSLLGFRDGILIITNDVSHARRNPPGVPGGFCGGGGGI